MLTRTSTHWLCLLCCLMTLGTIGLGARTQADDLAKRKPLPRFIRNPVIADRYLGTRDVTELLQFERAEPVCIQFLKRTQIPEAARLEAIEKLAEIRKTDPVAELLPWIQQFDNHPQAENQLDILADLTRLLPRQPSPDLIRHRDALQRLGMEAKVPVTSQAALAALVAADQSTVEAWQLASESNAILLDLLRAVPHFPTEISREQLFQQVKPLLKNAPSNEIQSAAIEAAALLDEQGSDTFDLFSTFVQQGTHPDACIRAITNISSDRWTPGQHQPLAKGLLQHLEKMPLNQRTSSNAQNTRKLLKTISNLLPSDEAAVIESELKRLAVKTIRIKSIEEQMRYDQTVLVLQAGQGVQIVFENHDIMPHNLVIVDSPAAREEVGIAADRMQNDANAIERGYLPESDKILHATNMIQPDDRESLFFVAPDQLGTYAFVCTFPGHWSKMYGAIVVVDRVDEYFARYPVLPSADELLGIRTVEWTYDRLSENLSRLSEGRSFENGQRMFLKASCYSCHKINNEGGRIGPELTKISEQYKTSTEILQHIMHPSKKVEDKYATAIVEIDDGRIVRGVIVEDSEDRLLIKEDPLATCDPTIIAKASIENISRSKLSPMPEQLLNTLVEESHVYDLLAYLIAGGNADHELFK
ncbi:MAG: plastocyanin/azurin family copper-binding protein [Pirellulaceae bacterium]|nr:plastocyanin/azurin family copper-binding protein [Pirellulaceae bacterium]